MSSWDSDVQSYLRAIAAWPLLSHGETTQLAEEIRGAASDFRNALATIPATARLLLEHWQDRCDQGLVTGMMCHGARDDRTVDWSAHVDGIMKRIRDRLEAPGAAGGDLPRLVSEADILFELLEDIHRDLQRLLARRAPSALARARALGLKTAAARRALRRASEARRHRDEAKQHFARCNLRLVVARAKRFRSMGVRFEDLIQEGNLGLLRAIDKFEADRGYRFSTYAVWWIDQALIRSIQNQSRTIRVPSHVYDRLRELRRAEDRIQLATGEEPSRDRVATVLGIDEEELEELRSSGRSIRSIDEGIGERTGDPGPGGERTLVDLLVDPEQPAPEDTLHSRRISQRVNQGLQALPSRDRQVLALRYGLGGGPPLSLREIGRELGVTGERVRQIEIGALSVLAQREEISSLVDRDEATSAPEVPLSETG